MTKVTCDCLAIPCGTMQKNVGGLPDLKGNLLLTVQVAPTLSRGEPNIPLESWPREIARLGEKIELYYVCGDTPQHQTPELIGTFASLMHRSLKQSDKSENFLSSAEKVWRKAFRYRNPGPGNPDNKVDFECLLEALEKRRCDPDPPHKFDGQGTKEGATVTRVTFANHRITDLALVFERLARARQLKNQIAIAGAKDILNEIVAGAERVEAGTRTESEIILGEGAVAPADLLDERHKTAAVISAVEAALTGAPREEMLSPISDMAAEFVSTIFGDAGYDKATESQPDDEMWGRKPEAAGMRKLMGILSRPSLANFLGCGVDIAIPMELLLDRPPGLLAVRFAEDTNTDLSWTAFELCADARGVVQFCPRVKDEQDRYRHHHLNMRAKTSIGKQRFELGTISGGHSFLATVATHKARNGALEEPVNKRRGMHLLDHNRAAENKERYISKVGRETIEVNFLEDLLRGYRPDVAIKRKDGTLAWRETTQRFALCTDPEMDLDFYDNDYVRFYLLPRDHGLMAEAREEVQKRNGEKEIRPEGYVFTWNGENIGLARDEEGVLNSKDVDEETATEVDAYFDLGLDFKFSHGDGKIPPLREGREYKCGVRLVYSNGASLPFDHNQYADSDIVIGDRDDVDDSFLFPYYFVQEPPTVHLQARDNVIKQPSNADQKGENSQVLAIRDNRGEDWVVALPPRIEFDQAELQGQFDSRRDLGNLVPRGAFEGARTRTALAMHRKTAALPEARYQYIYYVEGGEAVRHNNHHNRITIGAEGSEKLRELRQPLGTVALFQTESKPERPYYVDRYARRLKAELTSYVDGDKAHPAAEAIDLVLPFWDEGDDPRKAQPLVITLDNTDAAAPSIEEGVRFVNALDDNLDDDIERYRLLEFKVKLPEATRYKLKLTSVNDKMNGIEPAPQPVQILELIHAVKAPRYIGITPRAHHPNYPLLPDFNLKAITVAITDKRSWRTIVDDFRKRYGDDQMLWPSERGNTTYFVGELDFDGAATSKIRVKADWLEFGRETVQESKQERGGQEIPGIPRSQKIWREIDVPATDELFSIEFPESNNPEDILDLLENANKELRNFSSSKFSGPARKLNITLMATSSFARFYNEGNPDKHVLSVSETIWTYATKKPDPVELIEVNANFRWEEEKWSKVLHRRGRARIRMEKTWYSSGEGEQLGIVLLPQEYLINDPCDYYGPDLLPFERFLSRGAIDSARHSGDATFRIEPRHFGKQDEDLIRNVELMLGESVDGDDIENRRSSMKVDILPFDVRIDPVDGVVVDLDIDMGAAYLPWLQLGLVRFQSHAVGAEPYAPSNDPSFSDTPPREDVRVSFPIEAQVQVVPDRTMEVDAIQQNSCRMTLEGPDYLAPLSDCEYPNLELLANLYSWNVRNGCWEWMHTEEMRRTIQQLDRPQIWKSSDISLNSNDRERAEYFLAQIEEYEKLPMDGGGETKRLIYCGVQKFRRWD